MNYQEHWVHSGERSISNVGVRLALPVLVSVVFWMVACQSPAEAPDHTLLARPGNIAWGYYDAKAKPVLEVRSGDIVEVETLITASPEMLEGIGIQPDMVEQSLRDVHREVFDRGPGGHLLTGPIFVEGAQPGDALEVKVLSIDITLPYAINGCAGFLPQNCADGPWLRTIPFDLERKIALFSDGIEIPLRPFFGSMGVAPPPSAGRIDSAPPWIHAGNLDNKELTAGSQLFIPVHVPGALFEIGDGHAAQGDGEVDLTALETSLRGRIQLIVHKGMQLGWPRAETPTHYISMGMDPDLLIASRIATQELINFLNQEKGLSKTEAYRLASVAADLRITQVVDGNLGVHAMIPKSIFKE